MIVYVRLNVAWVVNSQEAIIAHMKTICIINNENFDARKIEKYVFCGRYCIPAHKPCPDME